MNLRRRTQHGRPQRRSLHLEPLEPRSLLAIAGFTVNLYEDVGGTPGALIADDSVARGDTFFVEILAREFHPRISGLQGVALDIQWDPRVLQVADDFDPQTAITPHLPLHRSGTLDSETGKIIDLGGSAFPGGKVGRPIGNSRPERFALLHFRALGTADQSLLTMRQGASRIATMPVTSLSGAQLSFERQAITVVAPLASAPPLAEEIAQQFSLVEPLVAPHSPLPEVGVQLPVATKPDLDPDVVDHALDEIVLTSLDDEVFPNVANSGAPILQGSARAKLSIPNRTHEFIGPLPFREESGQDLASRDAVFSGELPAGLEARSASLEHLIATVALATGARARRSGHFLARNSS